MYELLKFWKGENSILGKSLNFFTIASSDVLYLSILSFKISNNGKNTKIPKSHLTLYQNVLLIFYLQIWELFSTISNFYNLCFELMSWNLNNVSNRPNEGSTIPQSLPLRVEPIKYLCQPFKFPCIMCNHGHWNCLTKFDV
jgi:hypothetical protein